MGNDIESFRRNSKAICEDNRKILKYYNFLLGIILVCITIGSLFMSYFSGLTLIYILYAVVSAVELIIVNTKAGKSENIIKLLVVIAYFKTYSFCIFSGIIYNIHSPIITMYVFFIMLPVIFVAPKRVVDIIQIIAAASGIICTYIYKPYSIAIGDIICIITFSIIGMFIGRVVGNLRINYMDSVFSHERKEIELNEISNALKIEKERTSLALSAVTIYIWTYNIETGEYLEQNEYARKNGFDAINRGGYHVVIDKGYILPESINEYMRIHEEIANGAKRSSAEIHFNNTLVKCNWLRITYSAINNTEGSPKIAVAIAEDITQEHINKYKYEQSIKLAAKEADPGNRSAFIMDMSDGRIKEWIKHSDYTGVDEQKENYCDLYNSVLEHVVEADRDRFCEALKFENMCKTAGAGEENLSIVFKINGKKDRVVYLRVSANFITNPIQCEVMGVVSAMDVTDEIESQILVQKITDIEFDFISIIDVFSKEYKVVTVSSGESKFKIGRRLDYSNEIDYIVNNNILSEDRENVKRYMQLEYIVEMLENNETYYFTYGMYGKNGKILREKMQYAYLEGTSGKIIMYRTDITDMYESEKKHFEEIKAALEETQLANEVKTNFLSQMSHDLRTPMNGIIGITSLLLNM